MKTDQPPIKEPSVLDYIKSRLKFWEHGEKIVIPTETVPTALFEESPVNTSQPVELGINPVRTSQPMVEETIAAQLQNILEKKLSKQPNRWPWRSLISLVFALLGQRAWEPSPHRTVATGLILYGIGLGMLVWAYLSKEWTLSPLPETGTWSDSRKVRLLPLLVAIPLTLMAFLTLSGNLFTIPNVTLWVLAIICFVWAFWIPRPGARPDKVKAIENGPSVSGNVFANNSLGDTPTAVTSANQDNKPIPIGLPFGTKHGGSLKLNANGTYSYIPPAWNSVPLGGLRDEFTYTITDVHGATSSSNLMIEVSDKDRPLDGRPTWKRLTDFFKRDTWTITATRWTLLVLAVVAIVAFFRLYNIGGIPSEPFSDHAEKILDVFDVSQGQTHIFFPRNTGREAIQMYLTLVVSWIFGTGLSFLSLKIGTVICGLVTLPYMYLLGKEFGGKRLGLLAVFFTGIAYWPNVISRVGLRFPLYPLFVAPTLYYLLRGLRMRNRNDFILSGLFLGLGLHGYTPFRIVPIVVVIAFGLYLLHRQSKGNRKQAVIWLAVVTLISIIVFLPLARYWVDNPVSFSIRAFSRIGSSDEPLAGPAWKIFLSNTWNALRMFNWDNGTIWVHSVPSRPALDIVSGALFVVGIFLLLIRYIRQRHWQDLFLLLAVPLLQLPSILSLAFPTENPALNRAGGAAIPTFLIVALALDGLLAGIASRMNRRPGTVLTWVVVLTLAGTSAFQNFDLVFRQYATQYTAGAWNSSEMGTVIKQFGQTYGTTDSTWIVPYPYWVDTRLPGVWAGIPNRDFALWPQDFKATLDSKGTKLIILNVADSADVDAIQQLYPQGVLSTFHSATKMEGKDFFIFFIPSEK